MKKNINIFYLILLLIPKVSLGNLETFEPLTDYFKNTLQIQEGSFVGRGVTSNDEYQLTLLPYGEPTTSKFVVILERLDKASIAFFSMFVSPSQSNFSPFVLNDDRTTLVVPFDQPPQMTLTLSQVENAQLMLELKPLRQDPVFGEVVRFFWGRTSQVSPQTGSAKFEDKTENREVIIRADSMGVWADITFLKDADTSGTYRLSNEEIPGLYVLRKIVHQPYEQSASEEITHVVYFSRRVYAIFWRWGRNENDYMTTISSLSKTTWEIQRKED